MRPLWYISERDVCLTSRSKSEYDLIEFNGFQEAYSVSTNLNISACLAREIINCLFLCSPAY